MRRSCAREKLHGGANAGSVGSTPAGVGLPRVRAAGAAATASSEGRSKVSFQERVPAPSDVGVGGDLVAGQRRDPERFHDDPVLLDHPL
eukprot:14682888-Alexandrium_andersonii.AAC.1